MNSLLSIASSGSILSIASDGSILSIGSVGSILGDERINIGNMEVGRTSVGGRALMCLTVDTPMPPELLERIAGETGAELAKFIVLPE